MTGSQDQFATIGLDNAGVLDARRDQKDFTVCTRLDQTPVRDIAVAGIAFKAINAVMKVFIRQV